MTTIGTLPAAQFHVTVTCLVAAKNKQHALEIASLNVRESSIRLDRLELADEHGVRVPFRIASVDSVEWTMARTAEYAGEFTVTGHLTMGLVPEERSTVRQQRYQLPRSPLGDKAVLVLPTDRRTMFANVLAQSLEWVSETRESVAFVKVG